MSSHRTILRLIILVGTAGAIALANPVAAQRGGKRAPWVGKDFSGQPCKGGHGTAGTFDYLRRDQHQGNLDLVEEHHFTEGVENLTKGQTTEPMGDIDFLLRTFPNHHRALYSAMTFRLRHKKWPAGSKGLPAECYYQRAIAFSPRDLITHKQYAVLQHKFRKFSDAVTTYEAALKLEPGNELMEYNMGLALVELRRYKQAREIAEPLYDIGFPLMGLKNKLIAAGRWKTTKDIPETAAAKADSGDDAGSGTTGSKKDQRYAKEIAKFLAAKKAGGDTAADESSATANTQADPESKVTQAATGDVTAVGADLSKKDQRYAQEIAKFLAAKKAAEATADGVTEDASPSAATAQAAAADQMTNNSTTQETQAEAADTAEPAPKPDVKLTKTEQRYARDIAKYLEAKKAAEAGGQ